MSTAMKVTKRHLPAQMKQLVRSVRQGGGCLVLQTVVAPYEAIPGIGPAGNGGQRHVATVIDGKWYFVNTLSWPCPVCGGTESAGGRLAEG